VLGQDSLLIGETGGIFAARSLFASEKTMQFNGLERNRARAHRKNNRTLTGGITGRIFALTGQ
jgi:hypothetical protein